MKLKLALAAAGAVLICGFAWLACEHAGSRDMAPTLPSTSEEAPVSRDAVDARHAAIERAAERLRAALVARGASPEQIAMAMTMLRERVKTWRMAMQEVKPSDRNQLEEVRLTKNLTMRGIDKVLAMAKDNGVPEKDIVDLRRELLSKFEGLEEHIENMEKEQ